jgi:hypothetical protein
LRIEALLLYALAVIQRIFQGRHHLGAVRTGGIKGAAFY